LNAGNSTIPFAGKLNINIVGNQSGNSYAFTPDIAGNKLFVIHGKLNLYGTIPSTIWTKATSIVRRGDTSLTV
jgi:hypothetical protein